MTYLVHHGIKGQAWGVRNGPPYPLGSGDKSAREKRAEKDNRKNSVIDISGSGFSKKLVNNVLSRSGNKKTGVFAELAVYTAINVLPLIAYFGIMSYAIKKDQQNEEKEAKERFEKRNPKHLEQLPKLETPMEPADSMKIVNPGFPEEGHVMNCTFCTTAMVLREKGYDVIADTTSHPWYSDRYWERTFGQPKEIQMKQAWSSKDVVNTLESQGKNAYGNLSVSWKMGGGHSIFWKNDSEGRLHIYDGQAGEEYEVSPNSKLMKAIVFSETSYNRLDNVEPTEYCLAFVKPRIKEQD